MYCIHYSDLQDLQFIPGLSGKQMPFNEDYSFVYVAVTLSISPLPSSTL